jgi:hypothetical protein
MNCQAEIENLLKQVEEKERDLYRRGWGRGYEIRR